MFSLDVQMLSIVLGIVATMLSYFMVTVSAVVQPLKPVMTHRNLFNPALRPVTVKLALVMSAIVPLP